MGDPEFVLGMDIISFDSLYQSIRRDEARERLANAWMNMIAAQAETKNMKEYLEPYEELLEIKHEGNAEDFLKRVGSGF